MCYLCIILFVCGLLYFFFFKQKTAYEMRISDWSSDVCSSDLEYRVVGSDRIDQLARGQVGRGPALVVPVAVEHPAALVQGRGVGTNAVAEDFRRRRVAQLYRGQSLAAVEEMHVGVVETGDDAASTQFKHFGRGSGPASDFDVCADRRDLAVEDGDRLGLGLPWIAGPDLAVDEDRVGVCLGAGHGRGEGDRKPGQRERQQQESVHAPSIAKTGTVCVTGRLPSQGHHRLLA